MRVKNVASVESISKVLRGSLRNISDPKYADPDPELVIAAYEETIVDLLLVTPRPTKNILLKAALDAFDAKPAEAQMFASRLVDVIGFCRKKACAATSGNKL